MQEVYEPITPETVEAVEVTTENMRWVASWCKGALITKNAIEVPTLVGRRMAVLGSFVIRKRCGDFTVSTPAEFHRKYKKRT